MMLNKAITYLGINESQVMAYKVYDDRIVIVYDEGIKGCPKVAIPLSELTAPPPAPTENYTKMSARQLREVAKANEINGYKTMKKADLVNALEALD